MWKPLIEKSNITKYDQKLEEIYSLLATNTKNINDFGLLGGKLGILLFFCCYYKKSKSKEILLSINELVNAIVEYYNTKNSFKTFANGITGYLWMVKFLIKNGFLCIEEDDFFKHIESYINKYMMTEINKGNYDYMHGALGPFMYFLNTSNINFCEDFIDKLDSLGVKDEKCNGKRWFYFKDNNIINLSVSFGLSHGITSILSLLNKSYASGIKTEKCRTLIKEITNYLLYHKQDVGKYKSYFPYSLDEDLNNHHFSRLAWCYGDLGIGYSMLKSGYLLQDKSLINEANKILIHTTQRRNCLKNLVYDAGFCHGAAGHAHLYNRLYQITNTIEYKDAAIYWYNKVFSFSNCKEGLAGFKFCKSYIEKEYYDSYGVLEGIGGIGLVLISAITEIEPSWDEVFLL